MMNLLKIFKKLISWQNKRKKFLFFAVIGIFFILSGVGYIGAMNGWFGGGASIPEDTFSRGLVGYWNFDEGSGTAANDASGNGNNGALTGGPVWTTANPPVGGGGAMRFDGRDDYVDCGTNSSISNISSTYTIEAWINPSEFGIIGGASGYRGYLKRGDDTGNQIEIYFQQSGQLTIAHNRESSIFYSYWPALTSQQWTQVVIVWDNLSWKVYYNGIPQTISLQSGAPANPNTGKKTIIGRGLNFFNGTIDEVKIYNRALGDAEVKFHYNHGGPVGYWNFDEGNGTSTKDITENNSDAALYGGRNMVVNPSFETGTTGVSSANFTITNGTENYYVGSRAMKATAAAGVGSGATVTYINTPAISAEYNETYSYSVWYKVANSGGGTWNMYVTGSQIPGGSGSITLIADGAWHRFTTAGSNNLYAGGEYIRTYLSSPSTLPSNAEIWFDAVQIEHAAASSSYCDGSLSSGRWEGVPHASASTCYPDWVSGKYGQALSFDGVDDYINCGSSSIYNITGQITLAAWIKTSDDFGGIISRYTNSGVYNGYSFSVGAGSANGKICYFPGNFPTRNWVCGNSLVNDNQWHYAVVSVDSTNANFYVDGKQDGSPASYVPTSTAEDLLIGKQQYLGRLLNGTIDEVKIYNYARTADEIRLDYQAGMAAHLGPAGKTCSEDPAGCMTKGLAGYWDFDEASGTTISDKSGNGNNGTLQNGARWATAGTPMQTGSALQFDGIDDFLQIADNQKLANATHSSFSVETWLKINAYPSNNADIFYKYWPGFLVRVDSVGTGNLFIYDGTASQSHYTSSSALPLNQWVHVLIVRDQDSKTVNWYINGKLDTSTADSIGSLNTTGKTLWLAKAMNYKYFNGLIDEVRLYDRALSAEEARYHYNQGGPVGYWEFDEGSGATAKDLSTNNNDCMITGGAWAQGKYGNAVSLNGTSGSYINCGSATNLNVTNALTLSSWFYINSWSNWAGIVGRNVIASSPYTMQLSHTGQKLRFSYNSVAPWTTNIVDSNKVLSVGSWVHGAVTYDGSNVKIYLNGVLDKTANIGAITFDSCPTCSLVIGQDPPGSNEYFNGLIDEVKIYNYARSAEQIRQDYNAGVATHLGPNDKSCVDDPASCMTKGLVGYWDMNEGSGTAATDKSGNGNNGALTNGPKWATGKNKGALQFDGKDDYVDCGNGSNLNITGNMSIEAWVKPDRLTADNRVFAKFDYMHNGYAMNIFANGSFYLGTWQEAAQQSTISSAGAVTVGNWNHIVVTRSGTSARTYRNGVDVTSSAGSHTDPAVSAMNATIGMGEGWPFQGIIDEVRVYNRALAPEEVRYHYNQGAPVAYWKFDEGKGTVAFDQSANNNDGTIFGATWASGKYGSALQFNGTGDYINCGSSNIFDISDNATWSWWMKWDGNSGNYKGIISRGTADGTWNIRINGMASNHLQFRFYNLQTLDSGVTPSQDWEQWSLVKSGRNYKWYRNGIYIAENNATIDIVNSGNLNIGRYEGYQYFAGLLDETKIYNYARTADQIRQDYNAGLATHLK